MPNGKCGAGVQSNAVVPEAGTRDACSVRIEMTPAWLRPLAIASLVLAFLCAAATTRLLFASPQKMWIMNLVWPVTALYWGPLGLWGLWNMGTPPVSPRKHRLLQRERQLCGEEAPKGSTKPVWQQVAVAVTHCGAGCTLGDIIGEWLVYGSGWTFFGEKLYAELLVDLPVAFALGIVFQYFTLAPMRGLRVREAVVAALKADTISIAAFEVGLFGWMALAALALFPGQSIASCNHWFQMQIGMIFGFFTSYPANWLLLKKGLKEPM